MMQVWSEILLLLAMACFSSFAWALKGHFVISRISVFMRLLAVLGLVATVLLLFAIFDGGSPGPIRAAVSSLLYVVSLVIFWWSIRATRSRRLSLAFSDDKPSHLLQSGPYQFVRHPFYTAYGVYWIAGVAAVFRWYLVVCISVMLVAYFCAAKGEESKFANSPLRELYESYRSKTGMFLPRLTNRSAE